MPGVDLSGRNGHCVVKMEEAIVCAYGATRQSSTWPTPSSELPRCYNSSTDERGIANRRPRSPVTRLLLLRRVHVGDEDVLAFVGQMLDFEMVQHVSG